MAGLRTDPLGVRVQSIRWAAAAIAGGLLCSAVAHGQETAKAARLTFGAGAIGIGSGTDGAFAGSIEWQSSRALFWKVAPLAGALATSDGAGYVFAGVYMDVALAERWYFTPSVAVGGYSEGGGKDLGNGIEFRTAGEFSYRLSPTRHVGLSIYHLSNAGLGDHNLGTNGAAISYSVTLDSLKSLMP